VCALTVLGVKDDRWIGVGEYPPILSTIIKVSWTFIIQHALGVVGGVREGDSDDLETSSEDREDKELREESEA
jgi:hypothetical protein